LFFRLEVLGILGALVAGSRLLVSRLGSRIGPLLLDALDSGVVFVDAVNVGLGEWGWGREVSTLGLESVLIGGVGERDGGAIGGSVGVGALDLEAAVIFLISVVAWFLGSRDDLAGLFLLLVVLAGIVVNVAIVVHLEVLGQDGDHFLGSIGGLGGSRGIVVGVSLRSRDVGLPRRGLGGGLVGLLGWGSIGVLGWWWGSVLLGSLVREGASHGDDGQKDQTTLHDEFAIWNK
jgi:hypothetical protein